MVSFHVLSGGGYDTNVSGLLGFKQEFVVDGCVPDTQVVQCLAVGDYHSDQVLCKGPISTPGLAKAKHNVRLRRVATPINSILQGWRKPMCIVEDSRPLLLLEYVCVFDRGGAVIHDSPAQSSGKDTLVLHIQDQPSLEVGKDLLCQGGRMARGQGDLLGTQGTK